MDNEQLATAVRKYLPPRCFKKFLGCLTVDEVAKLNIPYEHDPLIIIVNILPSSKINLMGHWVLMYIENKTIYFLDSYGLHPKNYSRYFTQFLHNHKGFKLNLNKRQLQSPTSYVCGAYVLFFIHTICHRGIKFLKKVLQNKFRNSTPTQNDRAILVFVYKHFPGLMTKCRDTFCKDSLTFKQCAFYLCKGLP